MARIIGFLKQRWLISLIGVIALALFIWFLGPLIGFAHSYPLETDSSRAIAIGLVFAFWALSRLFLFWRASRKNNAMLAGIAAQDDSLAMPGFDEQSSQEELQQIREKMEEALSTLKKSHGRGIGNRQFLYQLPWYIIIGPPGCGKTTLLQKSDLRFPLERQTGKAGIRGVGGTRNCDWIFTEDAVLLDTAGRYSTQDSHQEADHQEWRGFLELLKKYRRRRPVNGAIVAISIADLLTQSAEERQQHAHSIRNRIQELYEQLGVNVPIYFIFTKCDLLNGFAEFFDDLKEEDRAQVWGATFSLESPQESPIEQLDDELELLEQRLHGQILQKMEQQRNLPRREAIYVFPQQFSGTKALVAGFVKEVFDSSRYQRSVLLRGVYFTSATQEGSPIDRILGSLSSRFGIGLDADAPTAASGKSFFINHLLSKVIFTESGLVGTNRMLERQLKYLRYGAFGLVAAVLLLTSALLVNAYFDNRSFLEQYRQRVSELQDNLQGLPSGRWDALEVLPILDEARALTESGESGLLQAGFDFGLSQQAKLAQAARTLYRRLQIELLLPSLMDLMEKRIGQTRNDSEKLFTALRAYLTLDHQFKDYYRADELQKWISRELLSQQVRSVNNPQREALDRHLTSLFEQRPAPLPRDLDGSLVEQARAVLSRTPLDELAYGQLKERLLLNNPTPFRISSATGRNGPLVLTRKSGKSLNEGIPTVFTYRGYHELFLPEAEKLVQQLVADSWVIGAGDLTSDQDERLKLLRHRVHRRYLDDFVLHWRQLLADIEIQPFVSLGHAEEVLNILAGDASPLVSLIEAVAVETTLYPPAQLAELANQSATTWDSLKQRWRGLVASLQTSSADELSRLDTARVSSSFSELSELVQQTDDRTPLINQVVGLLDELHLELEALAQTSNEELVQVKRKQIGQVLNRVKNSAQQYPFPLDKMLTAITQDSASLIQGNVCEHINSRWRATVLEFCQLAIADRYPIVRNQRKEITPEDFGRFFAAGGMIDQFFDQYLAANVDRTQSTWRWMQQGESAVCATESSLRQFKRARSIKNSFFRMGIANPSIGFSLKPLRLSRDATHLDLFVDGQQLTYAHGPIIATPMTWPGPENSGRVALQLQPRITGRPSGITLESPWALFRLFDQGKMSKGTGPEQFQLDFSIGGRSVSFELTASSAINPFMLNDLYQFRCPANL